MGTGITAALKKEYEVFEINRSGEANDHYFLTDVADFDRLKEVFEKIGQVDFVIHLAGDARVEAPWQSVLKNNIIGTRNVYECAKLIGVKKVIFASTNHVTGGYEGYPPSLHKQKNPKMIKASDPIRPDSDYGVSKAFGEAIARKYYEIEGIKSACIRIGSVNKEDSCLVDDRRKRTWLSHKDLLELIKRAMESEVGFGIYYGVSNNKGRFWEVANAKIDFGWEPKDHCRVDGE